MVTDLVTTILSGLPPLGGDVGADSSLRGDESCLANAAFVRMWDCQIVHQVMGVSVCFDDESAMEIRVILGHTVTLQAVGQVKMVSRKKYQGYCFFCCCCFFKYWIQEYKCMFYNYAIHCTWQPNDTFFSDLTKLQTVGQSRRKKQLDTWVLKTKKKKKKIKSRSKP